MSEETNPPQKESRGFIVTVEQHITSIWKIGVAVVGLGSLAGIAITKTSPETTEKNTSQTIPSGAVAPPAPIASAAQAPAATGLTNHEAVPSKVAMPSVPPKLRREPLTKRFELSPPTFSNTNRVEFVTADGRGAGAEREMAVRKALSEAMSKAVGGEISAQARMTLESESKSVGADRYERRMFQMGQRFAEKTSGLMAWWGISEETTSDDGCEIEIKLIAVKVKPRSADPNAKWILATLPFRVNGAVRILAAELPQKEAAQALDAAVHDQLVQTRKFSVPDGTYSNEVGTALGKATIDPVQAALQAAESLSADFALVGDLTGLVVTRFKSGVGRLQQPALEGTLSFRVIDVDKGQTVFAKTLGIADIPDVKLVPGEEARSVYMGIARYVGAQTLEAIYPLTVAALLDDGEFALNRGGDTLRPGDRLEMFSVGKAIVDPATGETLGVSETKIGIAEITRVLPKVSYAKILESKAAPQVGSICRQIRTP